jgi:hypothetical protein
MASLTAYALVQGCGTAVRERAIVVRSGAMSIQLSPKRQALASPRSSHVISQLQPCAEPLTTVSIRVERVPNNALP